MLELIVAVDENMGIGKNGRLPWHCPADLKHFRSMTMDKAVVMGRKTCETLPHLGDGRVIFCLSKGKPDTRKWKNRVCVIDSIDKIPYSMERIIVCGGAEVYRHVLATNVEGVRIHMSVIHGKYDCDVWMDQLDGFVVKSREVRDGYDYLVLERGDVDEIQYTRLLRDVLENGDVRVGRNGGVRSVFSRSMRFDLRRGFPLLTTKKMFLRGIIEELLFFLRGDTDTTALSEKGVNIWKGNTSESFLRERGLPYAEGVMGPMYGYQWRRFNAPYNTEGTHVGVDQLRNVVELIRSDPMSRRILMTTYNPLQAEEGVLYPCHSIVNQFYVRGDELDMSCYNRSQDLFLGTPYNIASSSLMLVLIAKLTNKKPGIFTLMMGDTHLYETHLDQAMLQSKRIPFETPCLEVTAELREVDDLDSLRYEDFKITSYKSYPSIKAEMSA